MKKWKDFERDVARKFSEWWEEKDYSKIKGNLLPFKRVPCSGAWATGECDVMGPDDCIFRIEVKGQNSWTFESILKENKKKNTLFSWFAHQEERHGSEKPIFLVFSKNNQPLYILTEQGHIERFSNGVDILEKIESSVNHMKIANDFGVWYVMLLDCFLGIESSIFKESG